MSPGERTLAIVAVAGPPTASRPRDIGIPPVAIWDLLRKFWRFDANEISAQLFNFRDQFGSSHIPAILRSRACAIAIRQRAIWELAAFYDNPVFKL